MQFLEDANRHLVVNMPPRALKSEMISVALTAYLLGNNPAMRIICVSYSGIISDQFARDTKAIMEADWYKDTFPKTRIARSPEEGIFTTLRGYRRATSVNGSVTGMGADLIIVDDPIKPEDARSDAIRQKGNSWIRTTLLSRANDKRYSKLIMIQQRVHVDDPSGIFLEMKGTRHLCLPAIADRDRVFDLGGARQHHWQAGEPLQPIREPLAILQSERERLGDRVYQSQYLQAPVPEEGGIIKWAWFRSFDEQPEFRLGDRHLFSWDTAMADTHNADYSVCTEWLVREGKYHLLNLYRERLLYPDLKRKITVQSKAFPHAFIIVEIKGSGMSVADDLQRDGVRVIRFKPDADKETRAALASDRIQVGNVLLPTQADWLPDFRLECLAFPNGAHDDQVDSMSQAILWNEAQAHKRPTTLFGSY
jgi:predicted phage terminase large subunit-like protein